MDPDARSPRGRRRALLLEAHAAALSLSFWQGALGVGLGERVPVAVSLGLFALEWALGLGAFGLLLAGLAALPGRRVDPVARQAVTLLALPFAAGASWLFEALPLTRLPAAGALWLATLGLAAAAAAVWLHRSGAAPLPRSAFALRVFVFAGAFCSAAAFAERAVGPQPGVATGWAGIY